MDPAKVEPIVRALLTEIGAPELPRTPARTAEALAFITSGLNEDPGSFLEGAIHPNGISELVVVRDVEIYSLCEHHLLPFFGRVHIGYLPGNAMAEPGAIARLVDAFARRPQIQERLTQQIAQTLVDALAPRGVGVVITAQHLCMMMRGVQKQNSKMVSSSMLGAFRESAATRGEFLRLIGIEG